MELIERIKEQKEKIFTSTGENVKIDSIMIDDRYRKVFDTIKLDFQFAHALFLDFNALMNIELPYKYTPDFIYGDNFDKLTTKDYKDIDNLAKLMLEPDKNFDKLKHLWETNKKFRTLNSPY